MAKIWKREGKKGVSYQIDYFDPNGKRVRKSFKKKKDAEAELGKRVSLIAEGSYLDVKKEYTTTLKELAKKYEENFGDQVSFKNWKYFCLENFKTYFGEDTKLTGIRYVDLETYRNHLKTKLTKNGTIRKDSTVNREMSCLHHIFTKAVEWDMMELNPFDKGKSLILKENNKRLRFLSEEEIERLLSESHGYLRDIIECAINTGMRRKEILSLKWDQIRNGLIYLRLTKTNESRQIPINEDLEALFERIRVRGPASPKVVKLEKPKKRKVIKSEYVFPDEHGKRLKSIKTSFKSALDDAGILDFKFHDLRHTFASHFIMRGGSIKALKEILGHKDVSMTMRYAHLSQEHKKKEVNLLNGLTSSKNLHVTKVSQIHS